MKLDCGTSFHDASLPIYDKMGKIVLDDIRDKFKRPEEARGCWWKSIWKMEIFGEVPSGYD